MENMLERTQKPRIVTVFSSKGGTGKTTIAALLAWKLAEQGESVLVVDLDSQSNISRLFGVGKPSSTVADVFPKEGGEAARTLDAVIAPTDCENVWIAPSSSGLRNLNTADVSDTTLRDAIAGMERKFGCIVIDCAPAARSLNENAVRAIEAGSEESTVVVPTRATATDIASMAMKLKMIRHDNPVDLASLTASLLFLEEALGRVEGKLPVTPYKVVTNRPGPVRPGGCMCTAQIPENQKLQEMGVLDFKPKNVDYAALSEILG